MRRRLTTTALAGFCLLAAWPAGASACGEFHHTRAHKRAGRVGRAPLLIGDSTSIIAAPILGRLGVEADAHGCRQFGQGLQMLRARRHAHTMPHVVALALGANGPVSGGQISSALRIMGPSRVLALVTARRSGFTDSAIRRSARRHPDRVLLVDWERFSAGHGGWFAGDGLHVGREGAGAYAHLIRRRIAPFAFPPVGRLKVGAPGAGGKRCGVVHRTSHTMRVFVTRGERRITCARARAIVRRPPMKRIAGWRTYDWRASRSRTWNWIYARLDRRVLVGAAPATTETSTR
jgi:hypothetical protein